MSELIEKVKQWGVEKGITGPNGKGTIEGQFWKFIEEMNELGQAIKANDTQEIRDALGDLQVVAIQAESIVYGIEFAIEDLVRFQQEMRIESYARQAIDSIMDDPDSSFTMVRSIARKLGHDPDECLQEAYDVISKRTGRMEGGTFVKDGKEGQ